MSIEAVISRVSQLQAMLAGPAPAPPATTSSSTSFSTALQNATGATATPFATQAPVATATATSTSSSLPAGTPYAAEITQAATASTWRRTLTSASRRASSSEASIRSRSVRSMKAWAARKSDDERRCVCTVARL